MQEGFYVYDPDASKFLKLSYRDQPQKWVPLADATCFKDSHDAFAVANGFPDDVMVLEVKSH